MKKRQNSILGILLLLCFSPLFLNADVIILGPADFSPIDPDEGDWYIYDMEGYISAEVGADKCVLFANVHLPHRSKISKVIIYYYDNDIRPDKNLMVLFHQRNMNTQVRSTLFNWKSMYADPFLRTETISFVPVVTVKAKGNRYVISVRFTATCPGIADSGTDLRLYGVKIVYFKP